MNKNTSDLAWWRPSASDDQILDISVGDFFDQQVSTAPQRIALTVDEQIRGQQTRYTYAELKSEVELVARGLLALGVEKGDHVAVMSPNNPEWVALEFALAKLGAVLVTVNPGLLKDEMAYVLQQSRSRVVIFTPTFRANSIASNLVALMPDLASSSTGLRTGSEGFPDLEHLISIGGETPSFARDFSSLRELALQTTEEQLAKRQASVSSSDVFQIQYTSGTTGKPKGAMLTHSSTLNNARFIVRRGDFNSADCLLSAMPLFHTAGCVCNVLTMLVAGGHLITMDAYEPNRMLELWNQNSPTILNAVPTMMTRMLDQPNIADYNIQTLRKVFTGGTTIPPSLMISMKEKTGGEPLVIMGMTETSPVITQTNPDDDFETQINTAGTPLPQTEIKIIDPETAELCKWNEAGELCIRGYLVTAGYFDMPEKTAETIDAEGWLHSGDLAELSESGHLRIVGRLKDMIIRGGENVYPVEIEDCLLSNEAVREVQVVGVPDADLGEEICAFVVPKSEGQFDAKALQNHCRANLARHKMPKYFAEIDSMPLTANGKIQKYVLRQQATEQIENGQLGPVK